MKYLLFIFLLISVLISCGCTVGNENSAVTPTPRIVYVTVPVPQTLTQITTVVPATPVTVLTTPKPAEAPSETQCPEWVGSKPVPSPVMLSGVGDGLVFFSTEAPGKVKFSVATYPPALNDESCTNSQISFQLAGTSVCNELNPIRTGGHFTGNTTLDLPYGGKYSLTTKGCYRWEVTITSG